MTNTATTKTRTVVALRDGMAVSIPTDGVPIGAYVGVAAPAGRTLMRGDELELTPGVLQANTDRNGATPWDDLTGSTKWAEGPLTKHLELEAEVTNRRDLAAENGVTTAEYIQVISRTNEGRKLLREAVIGVYRTVRP